MKEREIYPNPPIILVAVEVRHPSCDPLGADQVTRLSACIRDALPLRSEVNMTAMAVQTGPNGQPIQQQAVVAAFPRWTSRDKRTALTVRPDGFVIETTKYGSYDRVRELVSLVLEALLAVAAPTGVERIGLRYIDEIRVPAENGESRPAWKEWVDAALIGPTHIGANLGLAPTGSEGLVVFSRDDNRTLVLRYGAQDDYVIQSTPELRRPLPPPGPLFKLDVDSFWQAVEEVPEFCPDVILGLTDELHEPVRGVFESLISDRLREEVLRRD